jgi:Tfp pilus assembly protein PilF
MRPSTGHLASFLGVLSALAVALLILSACASRTDRAKAVSPSAIAAAFEEPDPLIDLSKKQERSPDALARRAPVPFGLPSDLLAPLEGEALSRATATLDEAIAALTADTPDPPADDPITSPPSAEGDRLEAARTYIKGRAARLAGEHAAAELLLKQAARLDPSASKVWRELALAQAASGNRAASATAFRRALALDPLDLAALDVLSRDALDRRDHRTAVRHLAALRALDTREYDPALPSLLSARLARALAELGYIEASTDAARRALDLPPTFGQPTQYESELALLYRQRGDLWRDAGDAMLRLGKAERASECYARATELPSLNPGSLTPRRVLAFMRQGRSADAASVLIDEARRAAGRFDDRLLALLRYVASNSSIGPAAARSIARLLPSHPRSASMLERARASCLDDAQAIALLREHLRDFPADDAAIAGLLDRVPESDTARLVEEVVALIAASPLNEARYARAAVSKQGDPAALRAALNALPAPRVLSPEASLLRARLDEASGDLDDADQELTTLLETFPPSEFEPAAIAARTSLLWRLGRSDEARALADTLRETDSPSVLDAKILALTELGEHEEARALLEPLLPAAGKALAEHIDHLLLSARLDMLTSRYDDAERTLRLLTTLDPSRDEPFAALLGLYARTGPKPDDARLVGVIRALRDANPSSPTLRLLRAQEAMQRGQLDMAERDLLDLAQESPVRPGVVESLARMWSTLGRQDRAENWLREQMLRRPEESVFRVHLALLIAERGRKVEALGLLDARVACVPGDDAASRALESLLRDDPSQRERAMALARARLARTPRSPDAMIELAEIAAAAEDYEEASQAIARAVEVSRGPIRADLVARLGRVVIDHSIEALTGKRDARRVLAMQRDAVRAAPDVSPGVYLAGIQLLARNGAALESIYSAIEGGSKAHPARRAEFFTAAFDALMRPGTAEFPGEQRIADGLSLAEHACQTSTPPPLPLHSLWTQVVLMRGPLHSVESLVRAIEIARRTDTFDPLLDQMGKSMQGRDGKPAPADEIAHAMAQSVNSDAQHKALVQWLYRAALRHNPRHMMANNNLGYILLEEGEKIDDAVRFIEAAYEELRKQPNDDDNAPLTDSIGWVRYKQGILHDEVDADGTVTREGALTLLKRSHELAQNTPQHREAVPIIASHYADALWAAGRREQAIELWTSAAEDAARIVKNLGAADPSVSKTVLAEIEQAGIQAALKADEAHANRHPPIAPQFAPAAAKQDVPAAPPPADPLVPAGMIQ